MHQHDNIKVIISGGGTGGHVYPAIAIADALKNKVREANILFVGANGRMEMEKVPQAGYPIKGLNISGLQRRFTYKNILTLVRLIGSMIKAKGIIKEFNPDVVVGVGGYASGPIVRAAAKKGIPTVLQEQNSYPGLTNKILAKKASKICVAYDGMDKYFPKSKIFLTGNPVRHDIINNESTQEEALEFFGLDNYKKTLLVIGGSLGAKTINKSIINNLKLLTENNIQVIWQTGKLYYEDVSDHLAKTGVCGVKALPFIDRMDLAYTACNLIVSRAGALSVSEIITVDKPAIFIPSPNVAEDHQTKNAMALVNHNAALIIKDNEAPDKLGNAIIENIFDEEKLHKLQEKLTGFTIKDSADKIAGVILSLINQ